MKRIAMIIGCLIFAWASQSQAQSGVRYDPHYKNQKHYHGHHPTVTHGMNQGVRVTIAALENTIVELKRMNATNPDRYLRKMVRREIRKLQRLTKKLRKQIKYHKACHHYGPNMEAYYTPMSPKAFQRLLHKVQMHPYAKAKREVLATAIPGHYFTARQIVRMMDLFSFSGDKTKVAIMMSARVVDRENLIVVHDALRFRSDQEKYRRALVAMGFRPIYGDRLAQNDRVYRYEYPISPRAR